jgi:DNA polymerase III epsilon subunit-like protein
MVQIAWVVCDAEGREIEKVGAIITPEGFTIPRDASAIHRITTERARAEGTPLAEVLARFAERVEGAEYLVAHNIAFDEKIVGAEYLRSGLPNILHKKETLCTMHGSTDYCQIPGSYGYKWPKLSELHKILFEEDFEEAHNAEADISATVRCFWEMRKRGVM